MKIRSMLFVFPIAGSLLVAAAIAETELSSSASKSVRKGETSVLVKEKSAKSTPESKRPTRSSTAKRQAPKPGEPQLAVQRDAKKTATAQSIELGQSQELSPSPEVGQAAAPQEFRYSDRRLAPAELDQLSRRVEPSSSAELRLAAPLLPDLPGRNISTGVPPTPGHGFAPTEELPTPAEGNGEMAGPQLVAPQQAATDTRTRPQALLPDAAPGRLAPPTEPRQLSRQAPRVVPGMFASFAAPVYPNVRVKDGRNIAPGAAPMLVAVKDPQACKHDCDCCRDRMVFVEVWAPPYGTPRRKVSDGGREVELDYGEYEVEIESKHRGYVEIDYDD